uniref:Innexin n=1 Tax=Dendrocoelum lacteum TaxID=27895 RepID=T1E108_9PLAT
MFFLQFLQHLKEFSVIDNVGLDDTFDRINYQGNVIVLLIFMTFVTVRQYFYSPISCFVISRIGGRNQDKYLQNMCWTEGLYPVNFSRTIPQNNKDWDDLSNQQLEYYAWVPMVLGLQAIMYLFPWLLWQFTSFWISGVNFVDIMRISRSAHLLIDDVRRKQVKNIANGLFALMKLKTWLRTNLLFFTYLFIKLCYIITNCIQLWLIYYLLTFGRKEGYFRFGERIFSDLVNGRTWSETLIFPRSGMCRFKFENLGAVNYMFAQCSLPINMINEKIYVFLYFYIICNIILTTYSLCLWIIGFGFCKMFIHTLRNRILENSKKKTLYFEEFVNGFLKIDGTFVLKMVNSNVGSLMSEEIINGIFERYVETKEEGADNDS